MKRPIAQSFKLDTLESRMMLAANGSTRVDGYLPDYRFTGLLDKLDWDGFNHINYFSIVPGADGSLPWTAGTDNGTSSSHYDLSQLRQTVNRAHNEGVTVSIVIGGDGLDASIPLIAGDSTATNNFANNMQAFCSWFNLDGIDLDWEPKYDFPPTAAERTNYGLLIQRLNTQMPGLDISAAVNPEKIPIQGEIEHQYVLDSTAAANLDHIGLMCYDLAFDFHSPWQQTVDELEAWKTYIGQANKGKLLYGLPFYGSAGHSWGDRGRKTYAEIVAQYKLEHGGAAPAANRDNVDLAFPDLYGGEEMTWYYNGPNTIAAKTQHAIDGGFGGVMMWELGQDRFSGGQPADDSLLAAIKSVLPAGTGVAAPSSPDLDAGSDTGASSTDNITKDNTPTFTGTAIAGSTVTLLSNGSAVGSAVASNVGAYSVTTSTLGDGVKTITATATLNGSTSPASAPVNFTIDTQAPAISGNPTFDFQTGPTPLSFGFTETLAGTIPVASVAVTNLTSSTTIGAANKSASFNSGSNKLVLSFVGFVGNSLPDGNYSATIAANQLQDVAGNIFAGSTPFSFFALAGDANHDRKVDVLDLGVLASNWQGSGKTFGQADFNYDGSVNVLDLGILASKWQGSLAAPAATFATAAGSSTPRRAPAQRSKTWTS